MTTLRKALPFVLCALFAGLLCAQSPNDCTIFTTTFTGNHTGQTVTNLSQNQPCVQWRVTYSTTNGLSTQVTFQTSPDNAVWTAVPNTICSATVQPPCVIQGTNPTAIDTQGTVYLSAYGAYVRVITSTTTGTGTGTIRVYGAKGATANAGVGSGGGGSGTVTHTGALTLNAVILGTGGADIKAGAVLPADPTKFYDGNGNFNSLPNRIESLALPVAVCSSAANGATGFSTPASNAPVPDCIVGSNSVLLGRLLFAAGATSTMQYQVLLPYNLDCSANLDIILTWRAVATTGSATWQAQTQFVASGAVIDGVAFNGASAVSHAPQGTTLQIRMDTIANITKTGCAANTQMLLMLSRLGTGGDTMTGDAELIGAQLRYARSY